MLCIQLPNPYSAKKMMMLIRAPNPIRLVKSAVFILSIMLPCYPTVAESQSAFVGMTQFRLQIEENTLTLIGLIASFNDKQSCKETVKGFAQSFIDGNAGLNVIGKIDAINCAYDAPPNTVWHELMYGNSFSHYVLQIESSAFLMIIAPHFSVEDSFCQILLNQVVTGRNTDISAQCLTPTK